MTAMPWVFNFALDIHFFVTNSYGTNSDTRERRESSAVRALSYTNITPNHAVQEETRVGKELLYQRNQCPEIQLVRASTPFGNLPFIKPTLIAVLPEIGRPDGM